MTDDANDDDVDDEEEHATLVLTLSLDWFYELCRQAGNLSGEHPEIKPIEIITTVQEIIADHLMKPKQMQQAFDMMKDR